jgi:SpoVK/Ycf46/Vps4 family AAA+-type ATPase
MARSDLLKKLFRGYRAGDDRTFLEAAREIVDDERKKSHVILANELTRILEDGKPTSGRSMIHGLEPLPKDSDRGLPLLEVRMPDRYLSDLVLSETQLNTLLRVVEEFRQWEVLEANGLRASHKLLFCGPPGCGKTVSAEALANELGLPLLYVRFDSVVSSLLGETAANLRKVFDYASRGSWVVLFDEFDAVGRSRDDITEHSELKRVVNTFLQLLDHFTNRSLVIAATNFEQSLDPALWRRFDEILRFERPDVKQIEMLLRKKLASQPRPTFSLSSAAAKLEGMSHAEIERVCLDVLRRSALKGVRGFTRADIDEAIARQEQRKQTLLKSQAVGTPAVNKS